ncbi:ribonuclease III [Candidatus Dojkabacteria bacterium]|nr:ribonuclease III [Candidatus Dojkabacteria bacterium]
MLNFRKPKIFETTELENLQKLINTSFKNFNLLETALTHRSYLNESSNQSLENNERLEFLGDAVLELIITEYLFHKYKDRPEGELTSFRAATVKTESLAETASELNLGHYIKLSRGEELTGGRTKPYLLANTYEALLGSIFLDQGYQFAKDFVYKTLVPKISNIIKFRLDIDNKSRLQILAQELYEYTPRYELITEEGPDHNKIFTMQIVIKNETFGQGKGKSKQEAEQNAAAEAIKKINELNKDN